MRDIVFLPIELVKQAEKGDWLRSLAYFVRMKSLYKNNTHYNFTLRSLAEKIKCSPAALSKHLKDLEAKGLIEHHSGNLTFLGLNRLKKKFKCNNIGVPVDFKNQLTILRGQIIRFNLSAQKYNIRKSGIQIRTKGFIPITKTEKAKSSYVGLSAVGVGNLFCLSKSTGSRLRSKLTELNLISVKRVFSVLAQNVSLSTFREMRRHYGIPAYAFLRDGKVLAEKRNSMDYIGFVSSLQKINKW
jgi:DNA-binding Lrp family transcriptional regulator